MTNFKIYHLYWKAYDWDINAINTAYNSNRDYGIYQVYGDHPVYGADTLLPEVSTLRCSEFYHNSEKYNFEKLALEN